jgi:hypothetical protein
MTNTTLVVVRTFADRIDAELAHSALEAAGIESILRTDDVGGLRPHMSLTNGVELLVRAENAAEAAEVLGSRAHPPDTA